MAIFEIKDLTFCYNGDSKEVLKDVNFSVGDGEFVVVCGESGCGKTTLLKLLKKQLQPAGKQTGRILYQGVEIQNVDERKAVCEVGFVMQNVENQIVTDKVWHELAFGLESLGEDSKTIKRKVAEVCSFFGISEWYHKKICELSGGQKQLLNLASIMAMQPKVLILDEPTSQLDPISATEFIATLKRINSEFGTTIILVEHRLEEVLPISHKVLLFEDGKLLLSGTPKDVATKLKQIDVNHKMNFGMPSSVKLFSRLDIDCECPISVNEGKRFLKQYFANNVQKSLLIEKQKKNLVKAIEIKEGFFRYERNSKDVLNGLDLVVNQNELLCILGANGAGKSTLLKIMCGINRLYRGKFRLWGKKLKDISNDELYRNNVAMLPQNPQSLFVKSKVQEDLFEMAKIIFKNSEVANEKTQQVLKMLNIENLFDKHPYDLSGGEQQKVAFAKILLANPKIILLDEPTKGLDAYSKEVLANILLELRKQGKTIVIVSHDIEFSAQYADRCAMFFDGQIVSEDEPVKFFSGNNYYTTATSRITRDIFDNAITVDMAVELCKINGAITR